MWLLLEEKEIEKFSRGKYWYTPMVEGEGHTILRMKQVLIVNIQLMKITEENKLQRGMTKKTNIFRSVKNSRRRYR